MLYTREHKNAEVQGYVCKRIAEAIHVMKQCRTEAQRLEYGVLLAAVMPRADDHMLDATASLLGFRYGSRRGSKGGKQREFAATKAMERRQAFDSRADRLQIPAHPPLAGEPLRLGEDVLCHGVPGELVELQEGGKCAVLFRSGGETQRVDYDQPLGKGKGSARLQRPPPLLQPPPRTTRSDVVSADVQLAVHDLFETVCPVSPHQRDGMKRRLSPHVVQEAPARILNHTYDELYAMFQQDYAHIKLSKTKFKKLAPWNLKKAYRETCLCRCCELFKLYLTALNVVGDALTPLLDESTAELNNDSDDDEANVDEQAHEATRKNLDSLVQFLKYEHKSEMVNHLVCQGCVETAKPECVKGECDRCGFKALWWPVRETLVDGSGNLINGASAVWQHKVRYEVLKSGGSSPSDGSPSDERDTLRERKEATLIELLDEFDKVSTLFPAHRQLVWAAKKTALQRDRNVWFGMLLSDYDWSENGVIAGARQIQSEYWSLVYYSLFIQITSYLDANAWLDQRSLLPVGTEVTVQNDEDDFASHRPTDGAFYAKVASAPTREGAHELYSVEVFGHPVLADGAEIPVITRERLRHRKRITTATIGVTDEKRHDAVTTQHFLDMQFKHWLLHLDYQPFWAWVGHSDNASHFKSGAMMNYWSGKMGELDFLKMCWIDFGCPGHGKGPWDGLGAVLKQQVSRDITNNKVLTESGYITCPAEVAEHLRARFSTEEWRAKHASKHINEILIFYTPHNEINRPRADPTFDSLDGARSTYSYMMLAKDQLARRERACWCINCLRAEGRSNMTSSGDKLVCEGCLHPDQPVWVQLTVRNLGTGLAGRRKEAQEGGKKFAQMLKAPSSQHPHQGFIAIQVMHA